MKIYVYTITFYSILYVYNIILFINYRSIIIDISVLSHVYLYLCVCVHMCGLTQKYILTHKFCYKLCPLSRERERERERASLPPAQILAPSLILGNE